jgi:transformation/transcription domain-associated protein
MDNSGAFAPDVDVERLVGLIVDPTTGPFMRNTRTRSSSLNLHAPDLETRLKTISELRDLYDIIKVSDSAPNMAALLARLLEVLRTEPAAFRKESLEYRFRKALLDLVIRGGFTDPQRFPVEAIFTILLHLIRHDNEDNAVACLKALGEASRQLKAIPAESLKEYSALLQECCHNLAALIPQLFSEGSPALDPEEVRPAAQSFQTVHEMVNIIVTYMQVCRALAIPHPDFLKLLPDYVQFIGAESPLQKKAREDYESMGNVWSGMAADMPNAQEYEHMLSSRGRVRST